MRRGMKANPVRLNEMKGPIFIDNMLATPVKLVYNL